MELRERRPSAPEQDKQGGLLFLPMLIVGRSGRDCIPRQGRGWLARLRRRHRSDRIHPAGPAGQTRAIPRAG